MAPTAIGSGDHIHTECILVPEIPGQSGSQRTKAEQFIVILVLVQMAELNPLSLAEGSGHQLMVLAQGAKMKRVVFDPRPNFESRNAEHGFDYGKLDNVPYWNETAAYEFSLAQINQVEAATNELYLMLCGLAQRIVDTKGLYEKLGLPSDWKDKVIESWNKDEKSIYGRFDLWYDGKTIKMLEFNGDTPTSLLETAITQYYWMKDRGLPDQFNSIHEKLVESWKWMKNQGGLDSTLYFSCIKESPEDFRNVEYLMDTAKQANVDVKFIFIEDIGSDGKNLYDLDEVKINHWFKLYPSEWLMNESFGTTLKSSDVMMLEPLWKMLISSKAVLPLLWEQYPNHPLLLPSFFSVSDRVNYVQKPLWGREGRGIILSPTTDDPGAIYQERKDLPDFGGYRPVLGSWIIGGEAAGFGIREDKGLITGNLSQFTPHYFK